MTARLLFVFLLFGTGAIARNFCGEDSKDFPKAVCYTPSCTEAIQGHIEYEFHAAFKYLYMGSLFGQYLVERPGMAKFFFESATEERGHAIQMLDYLNTRGIKYDKIYSFQQSELWKPNDKFFSTKNDLKSLNILSALEEAVKMEMDVTKRIDHVIGNCSDDFHAADVFTNPILDEQHTGLRKLQGAIQTLKELIGTSNDNGVCSETGCKFAEYIFDRKMLNGEV